MGHRPGWNRVTPSRSHLVIEPSHPIPLAVSRSLCPRTLMLVQAWHRGQLFELRYAGNGMRYSDSTAASAAFQARTVRTLRVVGTVSRLIQLSPRIAVGFGNGLSEPALLLGGRQRCDQPPPISAAVVV